ncbi:2OG-Fe(II) oxygenase [Flavobacterium sp.]|uniref:2OG-Fe(II) oxygenase n=1 Tax=Flavobacterium sp. TaxID=239 RepID=UPI003527C273
MNRKQLADIILNRLLEEKETLSNFFEHSKTQIGYFFIDDVLPEDLVYQLNEVFPLSEEMVLKKSLREDKFIGVQMNNYNPLLEEVLYAFQDERIVKVIGEIIKVSGLFPDENLYAGGISLMQQNQFLNPHLDNSHDKDRERWRVLNLLYYISPNWKLENGGNLELWPNGLANSPITIESKFNRLAVMATHNASLHSVSPVKENVLRKCISNYYFSNEPLRKEDTFHVTSFRGRPENKFTDVLLQVDTFLRMGIRKIFKKGIKENPHVYKKSKK